MKTITEFNKAGVQTEYYEKSEVDKQIKELEGESERKGKIMGDFKVRMETSIKASYNLKQQIKKLKLELPNNPSVMNRDALILRIELANRILNKH